MNDNDRLYRIMVNYQKHTEEIDWAETKEEAIMRRDRHAPNYKPWKVWIEVQTFEQGDLDECFPLEDDK